MDSEYLARSKANELVNPKGVCWVCQKEGVHQVCSDSFSKEREERYKTIQEKVKLFEEKKLKKYSVSGEFGLKNSRSQKAYEKAKSLVENVLDGEHAYDDSIIVEGSKFWFVPYFFTGLTGYVVSKESNEIYALGSGLGDMWDGIELYLSGKLAPENHNKVQNENTNNDRAS